MPSVERGDFSPDMTIDDVCEHMDSKFPGAVDDIESRYMYARKQWDLECEQREYHELCTDTIDGADVIKCPLVRTFMIVSVLQWYDENTLCSSNVCSSHGTGNWGALAGSVGELCAAILEGEYNTFKYGDHDLKSFIDENIVDTLKNADHLIEDFTESGIDVESGIDKFDADLGTAIKKADAKDKPKPKSMKNSTAKKTSKKAPKKAVKAAKKTPKASKSTVKKGGMKKAPAKAKAMKGKAAKVSAKAMKKTAKK